MCVIKEEPSPNGQVGPFDSLSFSIIYLVDVLAPEQIEYGTEHATSLLVLFFSLFNIQTK